MTLQDFVKKLGEDSELSKKLGAAANPDEAYKIATEAGLKATVEEFNECMASLSKAKADLSAADVDAIVGGASTTEIVAATASSVGAAASAASAAAV